MRDSWQKYLEALPVEPPLDPGGPVLVLSAHPDDEVLALGGWLAGQTGRDLTFVTATDGEASHPQSPTITPDELRTRRPVELVEALKRLGLTAPRIHRLGLPDGDLSSDPAALRASLAPLMSGASLVLAPFAHDGHPDHDALGAAALDLSSPPTVVWQYPVWAWSWTTPNHQAWSGRIRRLACSATHRDRKRNAIEAFETQVRALSGSPHDQQIVEENLLTHAQFAPEAVLV